MDLRLKLTQWFLAFSAATLILPTEIALADEILPMMGGVLIDGYDFNKDIGPKGSFIYDSAKNELRGKYVGLKMPAGRRAIFAWLHDTESQRTQYLGTVGWLKLGTPGGNRGRFKISLPGKFQGGKFGSYDVLGFTSELTNAFDGKKVVRKPTGPAGSQTLPNMRPAYYLFGKLPGADTELIFCGHGQDFAYAKNLRKQGCYD